MYRRYGACNGIVDTGGDTRTGARLDGWEVIGVLGIRMRGGDAVTAMDDVKSIWKVRIELKLHNSRLE